MGWNTVHALCGHTYEVQLEGRASARARKAEWLGDNRDCPDCYAKQLAADREAASVAAKAANADLPTLTGSPKQNAWAERIRYSAVSYLRELQEWLDQRPTEASVEDAAWSAMARKIIHDILHEEDSSVWIDNRDVEYGRYWLNRAVTKAMAR